MIRTAKGRKTIAVAEILTEVNSFSPVNTTRRDFEAGCLVYGEDIIPYSRKEGWEIAGFLDAVDELGDGAITVVPILKARCVPGGPVEPDFFNHLTSTIVEGLRGIENLDGMYFVMHGSMGVEGIHDPEGVLLRAVREVVGDDLPVGVTLDIHATVTEEMARRATFIVGYKTNPHRDFARVGRRAGEILIKTVQGKIRPVMVFNKMRLLKGGGMGIDLLSPMRSIFGKMKRWTKRPGVLDLSAFIVHIWNDDPELGWSTVAVTDGDEPLARTLADDLADLCWSARNVGHPAGSTPSEAIKIARRHWLRRKFGAIVFSDIGDIVGAGAPGESTWILKALLEEGPDLISYVVIRDEEAANEAFERNIGDTVSLSVGGKLEKQYNRPLEITGEIISRTEGRQGKIVVVKHEGVHLVLMEVSETSWKPEFWTELGLSVWKADIIVVKSLYHFRWYYLPYNRKTVFVVSPGTTDVDVFNLNYKHIQRPIFPLDEISSWR